MAWTERSRYCPAVATASAADETSVARMLTGGVVDSNASQASSASEYASSPVAQATLQTRSAGEPAARARAQRPCQSIEAAAARHAGRTSP